VQSRASLLKKHIIVESEAACPICNAPRASATHIVLGCRFARAFWEAVGWQPPTRCLLRLALGRHRPLSSFAVGTCGSTATPWCSEATRRACRSCSLGAGRTRSSGLLVSPVRSRRKLRAGTRVCSLLPL
jgi:hypothetical protein